MRQQDLAKRRVVAKRTLRRAILKKSPNILQLTKVVTNILVLNGFDKESAQREVSCIFVLNLN